MPIENEDNNDLRSALEESLGASLEDSGQDTGAPIEPARGAQDEPTEAQREYLRDPKGKFAPKTEEPKNEPVKDGIQQKTVENLPKEGVKAGPKVGEPATAEPAAKDPIAKAPASWKPEAREHWSQIPEGAKREIARVDQLVQQTMRESAEARKFADAINQTVAPYRGTIEAEGSNVLQAVGHLMQTAQALRTAPPAHKAQLVAGMVKQFGIDVNALDKALVGQAPEAVNPEVARVKQQFEKELAPLRQMQQQMAQQQQYQEQMRQTSAQQAVQAFEATNPEFLNDVAQDMAQILDLGSQRGVDYTLEQAYDMACRVNPQVRQVIESRERSKLAQGMTQTAQKAKSAAVSVGGAPSLSNGEDSPDSVRDAIMLAMNQTAR